VNRRDLLVGALTVLCSTIASEAQQPRVQRIAVLYGAPVEATVGQQQAFEESLGAMGYRIGHSLLVTHRGTSALPEDTAKAARDLVALNPDVIVAWSTIGAVAVKRTLTTIPVVFLSVGSPIEIGLVSTLARPGGTMTGVAAMESTDAYGKRLQLLKEILPSLSRVAVLYALGDPNATPALEAVGRIAPSLGLQLHPVVVESPAGLETAFRRMKQQGIQALLVVSGGLTWTHRAQIATLALAHGLPSAYAHPDNVASSGLVSLGTDLIETARQGAAYVDKILRGARPADLPVERPRKYELHVNVRTAKALGLTIPPSLLLQADRILE
jgi:putative tryptophan/tyrosine transport system substrate-binding protein